MDITKKPPSKEVLLYYVCKGLAPRIPVPLNFILKSFIDANIKIGTSATNDLKRVLELLGTHTLLEQVARITQCK